MDMHYSILVYKYYQLFYSQYLLPNVIYTLFNPFLGEKASKGI